MEFNEENKISKNCYKGAQVTCLYEVMWCAKNKLSLYNRCWGIKPASVICNMQLKVVNDVIKKGLLFRVNKKIYERIHICS